jgi:hypothetical protein
MRCDGFYTTLLHLTPRHLSRLWLFCPMRIHYVPIPQVRDCGSIFFQQFIECGASVLPLLRPAIWEGVQRSLLRREDKQECLLISISPKTRGDKQERLLIAITPMTGENAIRMFLTCRPDEGRTCANAIENFTIANATAIMVNSLLFGVGFC